MGFQAMKDVWARRIDNSTAKYVLLVMANYANDSGKAGHRSNGWPMTRQPVKRQSACLAWLEEAASKRDKHYGKTDTLQLVDAATG